MFIYMTVPKCASSMFKTYLCWADGRPILRKDIGQYPLRWTAIRHPVSRIVSAYHFGWYKKGRGLPFDQWWFHVKQNPSFDMHTQPIVENLAGKQTRVNVLEEIELWWPLMHAELPWVFGAELPPTTNATRGTKVEIPQALREEICDVYADDLALWRASCLT